VYSSGFVVKNGGKTMSRVGQRERVTQNRVVKVFEHRLGYDYLGNWQDRTGNSHIEEAYLQAFLRKQGYEQGLIRRALFELRKVAGDQAMPEGRAHHRQMQHPIELNISHILPVPRNQRRIFTTSDSNTDKLGDSFFH